MVGHRYTHIILVLNLVALQILAGFALCQADNLPSLQGNTIESHRPPEMVEIGSINPTENHTPNKEPVVIGGSYRKEPVVIGGAYRKSPIMGAISNSSQKVPSKNNSTNLSESLPKTSIASKEIVPVEVNETSIQPSPKKIVPVEVNETSIQPSPKKTVPVEVNETSIQPSRKKIVPVEAYKTSIQPSRKKIVPVEVNKTSIQPSPKKIVPQDVSSNTVQQLIEKANEDKMRALRMHVSNLLDVMSTN